MDGDNWFAQIGNSQNPVDKEKYTEWVKKEQVKLIEDEVIVHPFQR